MNYEEDPQYHLKTAFFSWLIESGYFTEDEVVHAITSPTDETKRKAKEWNQKYDNVTVHLIWDDRIGECISRYVMISDAAQHDWKENELHLIIPGHMRWANSFLRKVIARHLHVFDKETKDFVFWYLLNTEAILNINDEEFNKYGDRDRFPRDKCNPEWTETLFDFTEEEEDLGQKKAKGMGIKGPFVCFANRDSAYLNSWHPGVDWSYHDFRDSHVENFSKMVDYLASQGIQAVRMGAKVAHRFDYPNVIDYASDYHDDFMDFWLSKHCKFCVCDSDGYSLVPQSLDTPSVQTNVVPLEFVTNVFGAIPYHKDHIYLIKKYRDANTGKLMSLQEMLDIGEIGHESKNFIEKGIIPFENTAEEILDAADRKSVV